MACTITDAELAVLFRAASDTASVPPQIELAVKYVSLTAKALILEYAPDAPDAIHDGSLVRLAGWLYDADPADQGRRPPMEASEAAPMLASWRTHNVGVIESPEELKPAQGASVPAPPDDGHYILTSNQGVLTWVEFPAP